MGQSQAVAVETTAPPPPRVASTPAHAVNPAIQLVSLACPPLESEDEWRARRMSLVGSGHLHAHEATMADLLPLARRRTFVGGRMAMRKALRTALRGTSRSASGGAPAIEAHDADAAHTDPLDAPVVPPVLRNSRGAPVMPRGVSGSITHKHDVALAAVMPHGRRAQDRGYVGVDLERRPSDDDLARPSIAPRVLTPFERDALAAASLPPLVERERILRYFSVKEAIYKAIDPFVERYVGFTEVEVTWPEDDATDDAAHGHANVRLLLPELDDDAVDVRAQWYVDGPWLVATAFSRRR